MAVRRVALAVALGTTLLLRAVSPLLSRTILLLLRVMVTLASLATPLRLLRRPPQLLLRHLLRLRKPRLLRNLTRSVQDFPCRCLQIKGEPS